MQTERIIHTIDTHTAGESTRIIVNGYPLMPRAHPGTILKLLATNHDHLRRMLMWEPRGHRDMFGALLLPPSQEDTSLGVVFMHSGGYSTMCVHGLIGVVVAGLACGYISNVEDGEPIRVETPAGIVQARVSRKIGVGSEVTVRNVPSYTVATDIPVDTEYGTFKVDVAFGGSFFALVKAHQLNLTVDASEAEALATIGVSIRNALQRMHHFKHPELENIEGVQLVEISDVPRRPEAHARSVVIFGEGQVDRSPCGTGTCAKMARMHSNRTLKLGEEFVQEGILGTVFTGKLIEETRFCGIDAVIPEIKGTAFVTGIQQFVTDPEDPLRHGFLLGRESTSMAP